MYQEAKILPFFRSARNHDWTQQELAGFYRVESALVQAGLSIWTDRGVTDEGDPWFVFGRGDNEEVIAHFARIRSQYLVSSCVFPKVVRGPDFNLLVKELLNSYPYVVATNRTQNQNIYLHPAAMLAAFVVTAFAKSGELQDSGLSNVAADSKNSLLNLRYEFALMSALAVLGFWAYAPIAPTVELAHAELLETDSAGDQTEAAPNPDASFQARLDRVGHQDGIHDKLDHHVWQAGATDSGGDTGFSIQNVIRWLTDLEPGEVGQSLLLELTQGFTADHREIQPSSVPGTLAVAEAMFGDHLVEIDGMRPDDPGNMLSFRPGNVGQSANSSQSGHSPLLGAEIAMTTLQSDQPEALRLILDSFEAPRPITLTADSFEQAISSTLDMFGYSASVGGILDNGESQLTFADGNAAALADEGSVSTAAAPLESISAIREVIDDFLQDTPEVQLTISGSNVILVDADPQRQADAHFDLKTWELSDGSTVTLVGILDANDHLVA